MKQNPLAVAVKLAATGTLIGALAACGGGGSGTDTTVSASSAGTSVGPVSGFGSVYVNGTRFSTNGSVSSDDGLEREDQLEKGMVVKVRGSWDDRGQGAARTIDYDDTLRGPLESASWDDLERVGELLVAGQRVLLDGQTVFKGATPVELAAAGSATYRVRVSGWRLDDGSFRASFVGVKSLNDSFDDQNDVEVEGVVSNLDSLAQTFTLNGLPVDYQSAQFDDDLSPEELANGVVVEVEGYLQGGVLVAEEIDDEDDLFDDDDDVEMSGAIVGDYDVNARQFVLNGVTVQVTSGTEFDDGVRESDLVDGLLIKVEGEFRGGVLVAEDIESRDSNAGLEATVSELNADTRTLVVGGVRVLVTANTLIEDDDADEGDRLGFNDLRNGDYLEIDGIQRADDGSYLEALKIERDDDDDDNFEMEGRVEAVTATAITVMGLELLPGSLSLSGITVGSQVEIEYRMTTGGEYVIDAIELESDDD